MITTIPTRYSGTENGRDRLKVAAITLGFLYRGDLVTIAEVDIVTVGLELG